MVADLLLDSISPPVVRQDRRGGCSIPRAFFGCDETVRGEEEDGFVGASPSVQRLCAMARLVAQRDTTVLITGRKRDRQSRWPRAVIV